MKAIFTYPNNAATSYIDPLYVGDASDGFQKRIQDLKDGNYKIWDGTAPTDTVSDLMSNISKFNNYYLDYGELQHVSINDMYTYPLLTGTITATSNPNVTATVTGSDMSGSFVSSSHGLTQGDLITASLFNGDYAVLNGNNYYVDLNGINQFRLSVDAGLTQIVSLYDLKQANVSSTDSLNPSTITTTASHLMTDSMAVSLSGFDGDWADYNGQTVYVDSLSATTLQFATDSALLNKIGFAAYYGSQSIQSFDIFSTPMSFTPLITNTIPDDGSVIIFNSFQAPTAPKEIIDAINANSTTLYSKVNGSVIELYTDVSLTTPFVFTQAMRNYTESVVLQTHTGNGYDSNGVAYNYGDNMGMEVYGTSIIGGNAFTINEVDGIQTNRLYGVTDTDSLYYYNNGRVYTDINFSTEVPNFRGEIAKCEVLKNPDSRGWFHRDYLDDTGLIALNDGSGNITLQGIDDTIVDDGDSFSTQFHSFQWDNIQIKNTYRDWAYASANNLIYNLPDYGNTMSYVSKSLNYSGFTVDGGDRVFRLSSSQANDRFSFTTLQSHTSGLNFPFPNENYTPYSATSNGAFFGPYTQAGLTVFSLDATYTTRTIYDYKGPGTGVGAALKASFSSSSASVRAARQQSVFISEIYSGNSSNYVAMIPMYNSNNAQRVDVMCYEIDANGVIGNTMLDNLLPSVLKTAWNISSHDQGVRLTDHSVATPINITVLNKPGYTINEFFIPDLTSHSLRMGDIVSLFGSEYVIFPQGPYTRNGDIGVLYAAFPYTNQTTELPFNTAFNLMGSNTATTLTTSYNSWITLSDNLASNYGMIDYSDIPANGLQKAVNVKVVPVKVTGDYDANYEPVPTTTGYIEEIDTTPAWVYASVNPVLATAGQAFFDAPDTYELTAIELVIPANNNYTYQNSSNVTTPGAEVTSTYENTSGTSFSHPGTPNITLTTDSNGRLSGATLNSNLSGYNGADDIVFGVEALPDQYVPPAPNTAADEDIFDTADYWTEYGYAQGQKEFGKNIIPTSASITYVQPSTTNMSQNGRKYVRSSGFVKTKLEVTYTNLTKAEFQELHADAQAARGQATPFYLVIANWGDKVLNFTATSASRYNPRLVTPYVAGGTLLKLGGFNSNESEVFKKGEVLIGLGTENGGILTVLNTVDANVYGEAKIRIAYGGAYDIANGFKVYKNPYHLIVTLDSDEFQYTVDTFGKYNVTATFETGSYNI